MDSSAQSRQNKKETSWSESSRSSKLHFLWKNISWLVVQFVLTRSNGPLDISVFNCPLFYSLVTSSNDLNAWLFHARPVTFKKRFNSPQTATPVAGHPAGYIDLAA